MNAMTRLLTLPSRWPLTTLLVASSSALTALGVYGFGWLRPLAAPAYFLTINVAGLALGLAWPWNTVLVLAVALAADTGLRRGLGEAAPERPGTG